MLEFERVWAMPNKWTFLIPPIADLIKQEVNGGIWVDPFCGKCSPATIKNDLNENIKADYNLDALEFLKKMATDSADGVFYDPPYSISQAAECYNSHGKDKLEINVANMKYWKSCKNEVKRIIKYGGKAICFGWSSMGLGKERGFHLERILLVAHGGSKNDTIITVESKTNGQRELNLSMNAYIPVNNNRNPFETKEKP